MRYRGCSAPWPTSVLVPTSVPLSRSVPASRPVRLLTSAPVADLGPITGATLDGGTGLDVGARDSPGPGASGPVGCRQARLHRSSGRAFVTGAGWRLADGKDGSRRRGPRGSSPSSGRRGGARNQSRHSHRRRPGPHHHFEQDLVTGGLQVHSFEN